MHVVAVVKTVENSVQAKTVIESLLMEGYSKEHIHVFASSNKRAEDIADFFNVDAGATAEAASESQGFFAAIKNFFQPTPEDLTTQLEAIGVGSSEQSRAQDALNHGMLVIVAHHPTTT